MKIPNALRAAVLALPLLLVAGPSAAMEAVDQEADIRWLAWVGCWEDAESADDGLLVCFTPIPGADGVEIRTFVDGEMLALENVVADGRAVAVEEEGCVGSRTARWSADGARVYLTSELRCAEGVTRTTSGVMALADRGRHFLEIHAAGAAGQPPILGARRFAPASDAAMSAAGVEDPARDLRLAVQTARSVVAVPLQPAGVVEAVDVAGADVARALIAELGQPFQLTASVAKDLARSGVPSEVLDVMVAVSHPDRFDIEGTSWHAQEYGPARAEHGTRADPGWPPSRRAPVHVGFSGFYSPFGFHSPFFFGGLHGRRFFHPGFVGGPFTGRVVVVEPRVRDRQSRVSPGSGFTTRRPSDRSAVRRGQASPSVRPATIRAPARAPANSPRPAVRTTRRSGSSPAATSRPATTRVTPRGARTSGSGTERRARPRGGGGL